MFNVIDGGVAGFETKINASKESYLLYKDLAIGDMFYYTNLPPFTSPRIGVKINAETYVMFNPDRGTIIMTNHNSRNSEPVTKLKLTKLEAEVL